MRYFNLFIIAILLVSCSEKNVAQTPAKAYSFKKGEVLDIFMLSQKQGADSLFQEYVKLAFPIAMKMSYTNLKGRPILKNLQGSVQPQFMGIGKWASIKQREDFLGNIEDQIPDFHQRRRGIWSLFNMTYYEVPEDISFDIDKKKYNVVTAYWKEDAGAFPEFIDQFKKEAGKHGGKTIIELTNGKSPFMYRYQPDYFVITEWESKEQFDAFYKKNIKMKPYGVLNVNQFVIG